MAGKRAERVLGAGGRWFESSRLTRLNHSASLQNCRKFAVAAQRVREVHLLRRSAQWLQKSRRPENDRGAPRAGGGNVQPVETVQELHSARGVFGTGRRHRVDHRWRLLALELV